MRHYARTKYVTSLQDISIRGLAEDPEFSGISVTTLERWCAEDNWVQQRVAHFAAVQKEIESELGKRLVSKRVKTLEQMNEMKERALAQVMAGVVEANSQEGLITAVVRLAEFEEKLLDKIMSNIGPIEVGGETRDPSRAKPKLTVDEIRDMARVVLERRRAMLRGEKKNAPKLRVVKSGDKDG